MSGSRITAGFGSSGSIGWRIICASCKPSSPRPRSPSPSNPRRASVAARSSVDLDSDPRAMVGMREFDAPRELVWTAWTDPKHLSQWWGPDGFTTTTSAFDMRPGGVWRFVMHGPDGRDYENRITFDEIVRPERIRYHHGGGDDVEPVQFRTTVTFEDLGGNRTRLTLHA